MQFGEEEIKLSLCVDDIIVYIVNPPKTNKTKYRMNSARLQGEKLTCKNQSHFYILKIYMWKLKIKAKCHWASGQDGRVGKHYTCLFSRPHKIITKLQKNLH